MVKCIDLKLGKDISHGRYLVKKCSHHTVKSTLSCLNRLDHAERMNERSFNNHFYKGSVNRCVGKDKA